jgi:hypothetical protein
MTKSELAKGSAIFLAVAVVGFLSTNTVDQYFTALAGQKAACVRANGSWKNWSLVERANALTQMQRETCVESPPSVNGLCSIADREIAGHTRRTTVK